MNFRRLRNGGFELRAIPEPFVGMLGELPDVPERHSEAADARLYPSPSDRHDDLAEDWKDHVEPELRRLFSEARDLVRRDIASIKATPKAHGTLRVPPENLEAWMHALTQARLALAEAHAFTEAELSAPLDGPWNSPRDIARLQMDFYAALLEWIVNSAK